MNDPKVTAIYNQLKYWIDGSQELNASSMVMLVTQVIALVQQEIPEHGKGEYKKDVAMQVIKMIVNDSKLDAGAKASLNLLLDSTVPSMIDAMVSISRQEIDFHKVKKSLSNCLCL